MRSDSVASKETWSLGDAIRYIEEAAPDAADAAAATHGAAFTVKWSGPNRVEVFKELAERGWIVTSTDGTFLWFEKLE